MEGSTTVYPKRASPRDANTANVEAAKTNHA
jgi:hypothetical protein